MRREALNCIYAVLYANFFFPFIWKAIHSRMTKEAFNFKKENRYACNLSNTEEVK